MENLLSKFRNEMIKLSEIDMEEDLLQGQSYIRFY